MISFVLENFFFTLGKWFLTMSKTNFGYYWPKGYWVKSIFATHLIIFHIWCGSYKLRRFCFDINMHCRCLVIHSNKPLSILLLATNEPGKNWFILCYRNAQAVTESLHHGSLVFIDLRIKISSRMLQDLYWAAILL